MWKCVIYQLTFPQSPNLSQAWHLSTEQQIHGAIHLLYTIIPHIQPPLCSLLSKEFLSVVLLPPSQLRKSFLLSMKNPHIPALAAQQSHCQAQFCPHRSSGQPCSISNCSGLWHLSAIQHICPLTAHLQPQIYFHQGTFTFSMCGEGFCPAEEHYPLFYFNFITKLQIFTTLFNFSGQSKTA